MYIQRRSIDLLGVEDMLLTQLSAIVGKLGDSDINTNFNSDELLSLVKELCRGYCGLESRLQVMVINIMVSLSSKVNCLVSSEQFAEMSSALSELELTKEPNCINWCILHLLHNISLESTNHWKIITSNYTLMNSLVNLFLDTNFDLNRSSALCSLLILLVKNQCSDMHCKSDGGIQRSQLILLLQIIRKLSNEFFKEMRFKFLALLELLFESGITVSSDESSNPVVDAFLDNTDLVIV